MAKNSKIKVIIKKSKENEMVMVVSRDDLFADEIWNGINSENLKKYVSLIFKKHKFMRRGDAEENPKWKQIIPYMFFENDDKIFLMQRRGDHTESRLADMYSLGVGGHINIDDVKSIKGIKGEKVVMEWARREFEEEIDYSGNYKTEFVGILNHDANAVGMVHAGLVIRVTGDSDGVKVRDEHKTGRLVSLYAAGKYYKHMETWSQIVYDFLMAEKNTKRSPVILNSFQDLKKIPKPFDVTQGKQVRNDKLSNAISGVLPDWLIVKYIKEGLIKIEPLDKNWQEKVHQVSIDFHLGANIKLFRTGAYRFIDTRRGLPDDAMEEINLSDGDPFILEPGAFAITSTREFLKLPNDILGRLEGKSSLARLGILKIRGSKL